MDGIRFVPEMQFDDPRRRSRERHQEADLVRPVGVAEIFSTPFANIIAKPGPVFAFFVEPEHEQGSKAPLAKLVGDARACHPIFRKSGQ